MSDLRLLRHFVALYRKGSFRAAADDLGVTQSSVTKRIQLLETQLGVRLFNRTTRAVEPTDTARRLIGKAESTLQAASGFAEEARMLAGAELGAIRVGAMALAAETLVVDGLARLTKSHPNLEVEVLVGGPDIYRDLATGECDLVVGDEANFAISPYADGLRLERLQKEQLVFVHRTNHPADKAQNLEALLRFPLAIPSRYFNENRLFQTLTNSSELNASPRYRLNSLSACVSLAAATNVVTLAPKSLVTKLVHADSHLAIRAAEFSTGIEVSLAMATVARNAPTPAVRAFAEAIAATGRA